MGQGLRLASLTIGAFGLQGSNSVMAAMMECGPDSSLGDYRMEGGQRVWCQVHGAGQVVQNGLEGLVSLYQWVGNVGSGYVVLAAVVALAIGSRLTGSRAAVMQTRRNGLLVGETYYPERVGTARTMLGNLTGTVLKLGGLLFLIMGIISWGYSL